MRTSYSHLEQLRWPCDDWCRKAVARTLPRVQVNESFNVNSVWQATTTSCICFIGVLAVLRKDFAQCWKPHETVVLTRVRVSQDLGFHHTAATVLHTFSIWYVWKVFMNSYKIVCVTCFAPLVIPFLFCLFLRITWNFRFCIQIASIHQKQID